MRPDRTYQNGPVQITRHHVDWADADPDFYCFADSTGARLQAITDFSGYVYLNPAFTVQAPNDVAEKVFLIQANRACILWNKQISRVLGSGARRRAAKRAHNLERMLAFSGILLKDGEAMHTKKLKEANRSFK